MINTWNESLLHDELKDIYCGIHGKKEVSVFNFICDIVLDDGSIVEIQTANLKMLKRKLEILLETRKVHIIHPIAETTWIELYSPDNILLSKRKSPKHDTIFQIFNEITGIYSLLNNSNLTISAILCEITESRVQINQKIKKRLKTKKEDKRLIKINDTKSFNTLQSYKDIIPIKLKTTFTVSDLCEAGVGKNAGHCAWVLHKTGLSKLCGKQGRKYLYEWTSSEE